MKKIRSISTLTAMALVSISLYACKDRKEPEPLAGKGGSATILATPQHHGRNIDSCTIYIKYNSSDLSTTFDDSARCVLSSGNTPIAAFSGLKKGKYYLYGKGWDTTIAQTVVGGKPYTISEEKQQTVFVPVTEGD